MERESWLGKPTAGVGPGPEPGESWVGPWNHKAHVTRLTHMLYGPPVSSS